MYEDDELFEEIEEGSECPCDYCEHAGICDPYDAEYCCERCFWETEGRLCEDCGMK